MEINKIAVIPGSFDPITNGHLDIIKRASKMYREIIVLVAINQDKQANLSLAARVRLIKLAIKGLKNVKVDKTTGLTVNYAKAHHAHILIRGVRNQKDLAYEKKLAKINQKLAPSIKTVFLKANPKYVHLSSHEVIKRIKNEDDISSFVPKAIIKQLKINLGY